MEELKSSTANLPPSEVKAVIEKREMTGNLKDQDDSAWNELKHVLAKMSGRDIRYSKIKSKFPVTRLR